MHRYPIRLAWWLAWLFAVGPSIRAAEPSPATERNLRWARTNLLAAPSGTVITNLEGWRSRRIQIHQAMQTIMGPLPGNEKRCALEPVVEEEVDAGNYVRRRIRYRSEPDSRVPAYLLIPKSVLHGGQPAPAVLALHQTHPAGQRVVVGLGQSPNDEYGVELVQRGFVVLAPPYTMLAEYWPDLKQLGYQSGTMKSIWDNIRALDYLATLPFVRTNGFGAIGHSLGGHNGVYTAAFDERLLVVVTSCGLDSFVDYKDGRIEGWTQERYMPRLKAYASRLHELPFDFAEVIAAIAPRRCFISAPLGDTNFKWQSVDVLVNAARPVYALYGVKEHLQVVHPDCGHLFPKDIREQAYQLLEQTLKR